MKAFVFSILFLPSLLFAQKGIEGVWLNQREDKHIKIYKLNDYYVGKVVWMDEPRGSDGELILDEKNPDPKLRSQPILGCLVLLKMEPKGNGYYGEMYVPSRGWVFDGEIFVLNENEIQVVADLGFVSGKKVWTRVK